MEDAKVVGLIRRIRHDLGNHLQVIGGYAELGRIGELREYIALISEEMVYERPIFEKLDAESSLYFFQVTLFARDLGIILRYGNMDLKSCHLLRKENEPYKSLAEISEQLGESIDEDPIVYLSLAQEALGVRMIFNCDQLPSQSLEVWIQE